MKTDWKVLLKNNPVYKKSTDGKNHTEIPDEEYEMPNEKKTLKDEESSMVDLNKYFRSIDSSVDKIFQRKRNENRVDVIRCFNPEFEWGNIESIGSRADESSKLGKNPNKDHIFHSQM